MQVCWLTWVIRIISRDAQEAYIDMVYDVNKDKEETIYGVPFATNASGVIYNTEKIEELGLEVPKTWDEFIDILQKIKDAGEQPLLMTYKDAWTANAPWNSIAADLCTGELSQMTAKQARQHLWELMRRLQRNI